MNSARPIYHILKGCQYRLYFFQLIRALALETAYPAYTEVKLSTHILDVNDEVIDSIEHGVPRGPCRVVTGSRAEGLAIEPGWGYPHPDTDIMIIHGGEWTAWSGQYTGRYLCPSNTQCLPGFYRLEFNELSFEQMLRYKRYTSRIISLGFPYWFRLWLLHFFILTKLITCRNAVIFVSLIGMCRHNLELDDRCPYLPLPKLLSRILLAIPMVSHRMLHNLKWCKKHFPFKGLYLSSRKALNLFGHVMANSRLWPFTIYCVGGPTYKDLIFNQDLVPALLCDDTYSQSGYNFALTPKILVPVGHPQSPHKDIEWRESHSLIEIQMAGDFPNWVKQAYWAFKYTFQHCVVKFGLDITQIPLRTDGRWKAYL